MAVHLQQQLDEQTEQARRAKDEYMKVACELLLVCQVLSSNSATSFNVVRVLHGHYWTTETASLQTSVMLMMYNTLP